MLPLLRARFWVQILKQLSRYRRIAAQARKVWLEHGALEYRECVGDDLDIAQVFPFTKLNNVKKNELLIFSWIVYKSKANRDRVNTKVMKDPRLDAMMDPKKPLFDVSRMAYGGFNIIVGK